MRKEKLRLFGDVMGLSPFPLRFKQALITFRGEEDVPKSKFGFSSLKLLHPKISPKLWRGKPYLDKTVIISNLFNHTQTPVEEGWSVRKTQVRDFRGKDLTYNSHNGTDLAIPVGSSVCTAAPGEVVEIRSELNRGGLKVFIDHGEGLMTCYAHLAKAKVRVGDIVGRSQEIAISGYSGLDGVLTYPFGIPHIHFNVWLNGEPVDPFAYGENKSMWAGIYLPTVSKSSDSTFTPSEYNETKTNAAIITCKTLRVRERISSIKQLKYKAAHTIIEMNYYPTRFSERINIYDKEYAREPRLDLPFKAEEFEKVVFLDDILM